MELTLTRQAATTMQVNVTCDGSLSHTFDLRALIPDEKHGPAQPIDDPIAYGKAVYQALFPPETPARRALDAISDRFLLVTTDPDIDAVPWEYAYGPDDFLVLEYPFVRGLAADQRIDPPTLDSSLYIVAVPSNPLAKGVPPLNIDGEWTRLREIISEVPSAITLERTRPPTIEQVRRLVANQRHRIIHFMGHGGQHESGAVLLFEQNNGDLDPVTAKDFVRRVRGTVFLVTLNACVSATPGGTDFSNLAAALVQQKTPYALGMRLSIVDDDARTFSREFYSELARGISVEEALYQARLSLAKSPRRWVVGVPVLYTSLKTPAVGFATTPGTPVVKEHQPHMEVNVLPRAEGVFQGRIDELKEIGTHLTGDNRPRLLTIHGAGGQGKTTLAREAVERFAYAWPGGVWATTLENLPSREVFVIDLARFLGIDTQNVTDLNEIERPVIAQLSQRRTLIVLDNAETLVEAVKADNESALRLAQFIREQLPSASVSLLAASREYLEWNGEIGLEHDLEGLEPDEGAQLFRQSAPQRKDTIDMTQAEQLSHKVEGHPLSLRLLGGAFNASAISLLAFINAHEAQLLQAENKYVGPEHRHRTLYASIDTSVRYLDADLRALLSGLWIFHAPFLDQTAVAIFDLKTDYPEGERSPIYDRLHALWLRGLLVRETATVRDGTILLYRLLPTMRPYLEKYMAQAYEREALLARFGSAYAQLARFVYSRLDSSAASVYIAQQTREDFEHGVTCVTGIEKGYYLLHWGWVLQRLIDTRRGLKLTEQALEIAQGQDQELESQALNNMARVYYATGQRQRALALNEQTLPLMREVGDHAGEAATLDNMAQVYNAIGQPQRALALLEEALSIMREVGDREGEAVTLNNMAEVYRKVGQPQRALELYEQALPIVGQVGNRTGEAIMLNNMGLLYDAVGQPQRALALYEQALPIIREVGDRAGEATTLNNIALVNPKLGQPQQALALFKQALSIRSEVGDRAGEANTLNNMVAVYNAIGQPQQALALYKQALQIRREVGDRAGEANTLNNMAAVYDDIGQPQQALALYEQALPIIREVGDRAGEATTLANIAILLYQSLNRSQEAIAWLEQAIYILVETGLPQDAGGNTLDKLREDLETMRRGVLPGAPTGSPATMPAAQIQQIVTNTIAVMTVAQERRAAWRKIMVENLQHAQQQGVDWQIEIDFFTTILAILDGQPSTLPKDHPYAQAIASIQSGIASGGPHTTTVSDEIMKAVSDFVNARDLNASRQVLETQQLLLFQPEVETLFEKNIAQARTGGDQRIAQMLEQRLTILRACKANGIAATFEQLAAIAATQEDDLDDLPFDAELIPRSIAALLGGPQEKMAHVQYLTKLTAETTDEGLKALINTIQLALFGSNLSQLGQNLDGVYRQAWDIIVKEVETGGASS